MWVLDSREVMIVVSSLPDSNKEAVAMVRHEQLRHAGFALDVMVTYHGIIHVKSSQVLLFSDKGFYEVY